MAKADDGVSISLRDAKALLVSGYGSAQLAEELLVEELATGRMPWKYKIARDNSPTSDREFWRFGPKVDYEESSARTMYVPGPSYYGITVSRAHVVALLPEETGEHEEAAASKVWIAAEARRMKAAGEIPTKITDFARDLARRMRKAADADRSIRPIKWESIRNMLPKWDLWPVTLIK
jgi:hypothetical protein